MIIKFKHIGYRLTSQGIIRIEYLNGKCIGAGKWKMTQRTKDRLMAILVTILLTISLTNFIELVIL